MGKSNDGEGQRLMRIHSESKSLCLVGPTKGQSHVGEDKGQFLSQSHDKCNFGRGPRSDTTNHYYFPLPWEPGFCMETNDL